MFPSLKYVPGALPGKALKRKSTDSSYRSKQYEEKRERKFLQKWCDGREWLKFDGTAMTCALCLDYSSITSNGLKDQNTFLCEDAAWDNLLSFSRE